jgi:hypothetical protein
VVGWEQNLVGVAVRWSVELLVTDDPLPFQFGILLIRQVDVVAAPAPCANAVLESLDIFRIAADYKTSQVVQRSEAIGSSGLSGFCNPAP